MTEREKMFCGKVYDPFSEGMPEERTRTHVLCKAYNDTTETDKEKREEILKELRPCQDDCVNPSTTPDKICCGA